MIETQETLKRSRRDGRSVQTDFHEPDNHNGVVSHPEPDILECEVKWTLESTAINNASGCDGIPGEPFKTLKDDVIKVLHLVCQQIWKTQQWSQDWKRSTPIPFPRRVVSKNVPIIQQLHSSPMLVRTCLKSFMLGFSICKRRTSRCPKCVQKRQRNQRSSCQHLLDHRESKGISEKHLSLFQ